MTKAMRVTVAVTVNKKRNCNVGRETNIIGCSIRFLQLAIVATN